MTWNLRSSALRLECLLLTSILGFFTSPGLAIDDELYEEIDQDGLYEEAIEIITANPNRQGFRKAATYLKKAAKAGKPEAQYALGSLYLYGQGVRRNQSIAAKWFEQSAEQGHRAAMYYLAVSKLTGEGAEKDRSGSKQLFNEIVYPGGKAQIRVEDFRWQRAIRAESSYFLASLLMEERSEIGGNSRDSEIIDLMSTAAKSGSANATMFLALERAKGTLLERDLELTKKYLDDYHLIMSDSLRRSLDQFFVDGIDSAIARDLERESEDVEKALYQEIYAGIYSMAKVWLDQPAQEREVSISSIIELLTIAAEGDYPLAQIELGFLYSTGDEVTADHGLALNMFSKALKSSPRIAVFNKAVLLRIGEGIDRDEALSRKLLLKAKNAGLYAAAAVLDGDLEPKILNRLELLELCRERRETGDPRAMYSYLFRQELGIGVERETNSKRLFRGYLDAAKKGSIQAMATVGDRYFYGNGVKEDCGKALSWFERAEKGADPDALFMLGYMRDIGKCLGQDSSKAVAFYRESVERGNINAMNNLAVAYHNEAEYKEFSSEAIGLWERAAEGGSALAMRNLGSAHMEGSLINKDTELAVEYYSKAAELGDIPAIKELVEFYRRGKETDSEEESYWLERAAESGDVDSMAAIALRYYSGHGVPESKMKAMMWANHYLEIRSGLYGSVWNSKVYLMVADLMATRGWVGYDPVGAIKLYSQLSRSHLGEAGYELARHYRIGSLGEENRSKAYKLYRKIANQYEPSSNFFGKCAYEIAICYRDGIGVKMDKSKWIDWLEKAAATNNPLAAYDLGMASMEGNGLEKDEAKAFKLMLRASRLGLRKAHFWLSEYYFQNDPESDAAKEALGYLKSLANEGNMKARTLLRKFDYHWVEGKPAGDREDREKPSEEERPYAPVNAA